jgi:hypothetical protein
MAVTVTKAAPSLTISDTVAHSHLVTPYVFGAYGVPGAAVVASPTDFLAGKRVRVCKITLSGTYATGGFALAAADYGLKEIHALLVLCNSTSTSVPISGGTMPALDISASTSAPTVRLYTDTATELANATSVTNFVWYAVIVGV